MLTCLCQIERKNITETCYHDDSFCHNATMCKVDLEFSDGVEIWHHNCVYDEDRLDCRSLLQSHISKCCDWDKCNEKVNKFYYSFSGDYNGLYFLFDSNL